MRRKSKEALNRRYISSVYKFHKWMYEGRVNRAIIEAMTAELYEFFRPSFRGDVIWADQVTLFRRDDDVE